MIEKFYSQEGEDYLLWKFFNEKKDGFFIEIGAFDGIHFSNTYFFEKAGWKGICIEPSIEMFKRCSQNRQKSKCLNSACVGDENIDNISFYEEKFGLFSTTAMSSKVLNEIKQRYQNRDIAYEDPKEYQVKAVTLNNVLKDYSPNIVIDFISIDTEGNELEVLKGIDFAKYNIRVLLIEANDKKSAESLEKYLHQFGYKLARKTVVNYFFLKDEEEIKRLDGIPINCTITKQIHPFGEKYTRARYLNDSYIRNGKVINV